MPELPPQLSWLMDPSAGGLEGLDARWIVLAIGTVLVIFGSRFYKLLLITPGFVGGVLAALEYAPEGDSLTQTGVALVAGIVGAAILLYVERLALAMIGVAVFGGLAIAALPLVLGPGVHWTVMAAVAAVGAFVVPFVYRRSLKVVTPFLGAITIAWTLDRPDDLWLILGLGLAGAVLQLTLTGKKLE